MSDADTRPEAESPAELSEGYPRERLSSGGIARMQGKVSDAGREWKDLGIIDVPVANLPKPDGADGPQDFDHHISYPDAIAASRQLPDLQEQVRAGKTGDDFWADDQAAGLDYAHGRQRLYDLYYGSDPVRLDKVGDQYDIVSGRHRIFAAKELGLATIPAHVREKVQ